MNWITTAIATFVTVLIAEFATMIALESVPHLDITTQLAALIDGLALGVVVVALQLLYQRFLRTGNTKLLSSDWQSAGMMMLATVGFETSFHPLSQNLAKLHLPIDAELLNALLTAAAVAAVAVWMQVVDDKMQSLSPGKATPIGILGRSIIAGAIVSATCVTTVAVVREVNQGLLSQETQIAAETSNALAKQRAISQKIARLALLQLSEGGQEISLAGTLALAKVQRNASLSVLRDFIDHNRSEDTALQVLPSVNSYARASERVIGLALAFSHGDQTEQVSTAHELQYAADELWSLTDQAVTSIAAFMRAKDQRSSSVVGNAVSASVAFLMTLALLWPMLRLIAAQKGKNGRDLLQAGRLNRSLVAYQRAIDSHAIFSVTDRMGQIILVNGNFSKASGYERDYLLRQNHRLLNSGVHSPVFFTDLWRTISQGNVWRGDMCNRGQDGRLYWIDTCITPLLGDDGKIEQYVSIGYDITQRKDVQIKADRRLRLENLLLELRKELLSSGSMYSTTAKLLGELNVITGAHASLVCEVGLRHEGQAWSLLVAHNRKLEEPPVCEQTDEGRLHDVDLQPSLIRDVMQQDGLFGGMSAKQLGANRFHGHPITVGFEPVGILLLSDDVGKVDFVEEVGLVVAALAELISARRESDRRRNDEDKTRKQAKRDTLTGLGNRRELMDAFDSRRDHPDANFALLLIDLDRFKPINDTFGHAVGDTVLRVIAERLRTMDRGDITVTRIGGDEFAILTEARAHEDETAALHMGNLVLEELSRPIDCNGHELLVGASVGVALYPRDGASFQELLHRADAAMYRAKGNRSEAIVFDASMDEAIRDRAELETDLRKAIDSGEIQPWFQPFVNLKTGVIVGHEVLARWKHERRGFVSPAEFIKIAEEAGMVDKLFRQFLHTACRKHLEQKLATVLSINLSPTQIKNPLFAKQLVEDLEQIGFPPHLLEVEITETSMIGDLERARPLLLLLRSKGIRIALDDFGTGYSSLSLLRNMPISKVKIDRSFTADVEVADGTGVTIVNAILGIAKALRLQVTAEGIETPEVAEFLRDIGCEYGQGYLYARAEPEFLTELADPDVTTRLKLVPGAHR